MEVPQCPRDGARQKKRGGKQICPTPRRGIDCVGFGRQDDCLSGPNASFTPFWTEQIYGRLGFCAVRRGLGYAGEGESLFCPTHGVGPSSRMKHGLSSCNAARLANRTGFDAAPRKMTLCYYSIRFGQFDPETGLRAGLAFQTQSAAHPVSR
jgi:hypothetical protein